MSSRSLTGALCLAVGLTAGISAASQNPTQQPPASDKASVQPHNVTVEGCLVREKDVPGRQPNVAERSGVMEDFILTNVKFLKGAAHTTPDASATGTAGATGTTGTAAQGRMFEVRGLPETQIQQYIGQRVEIEGRITPADLPERAREKASSSGEPAGDLPELTGTVIRKSTSDVPCTPAEPKK